MALVDLRLRHVSIANRLLDSVRAGYSKNMDTVKSLSPMRRDQAEMKTPAIDVPVLSGGNGVGKEKRAIHISGYDRKPHDFYATPDWVTAALLKHVAFRGPIWEPCCGDGAISRLLEASGYKVVSTDIAERGYGKAGVNFLTCQSAPAGCRAIVTNPPYGDTGSHVGQTKSSQAMLHFLRHALDLTRQMQGQLALLVRLNWLAGKRAAEMMSSAPFAAAIILTRRIRWFERGEDTNTAQHHHAWVVFDYAHPSGTPPTLLYA